MKPVIKFAVEKVADGYTAYAKERSIITEADNLKELDDNIKEAFELQCEHLNESPADYIIKLEYDIPTFFEVYSVISVRSLAERLGMNNSLISQYISGAKEPSRKQKERMLAVINQIGTELAQLTFA